MGHRLGDWCEIKSCLWHEIDSHDGGHRCVITGSKCLEIVNTIIIEGSWVGTKRSLRGCLLPCME